MEEIGVDLLDGFVAGGDEDRNRVGELLVYFCTEGAAERRASEKRLDVSRSRF